MKWNLLSNTIPINVQSIIEVVLRNRGILDNEAFLHPTDPMHLKPIDVGIDEALVGKAIERLAIAKEKGEKIIFFGDYDCDGICATAVLWETLHGLGYCVFPFIPDRKKHGYGLSTKAIDELLASGKPQIVISVDNGIVAHKQWQRLKDEGIFTILTDHHESDGTIPPAQVIIHTTALCGTTVAWMLALALDRKKASSMLDLCCLATIADQVQLVGANRSFAKFGLAQLNDTKRLGLKLLIEAAALETGKISTRGVSFGIVPRINAMGRLGNALDSLRAICTKNKIRAQELVATLHTTNLDRQDMTEEFIIRARIQAANFENERIIVVADSSFHEGVIGLIASRLTEEFHKPSIVISIGELSSKGSGRSVTGVHITNLLRSVGEDLMEVGGHPMAAGLRVETGNIEQFTMHLVEKARQTILLEQLVQQIDVDCELPNYLISLETALQIDALAPFGAGNHEPIFLLKNMLVSKSTVIGKEGKHLKLVLQSDSDSLMLCAVGFGMGERIVPTRSRVDCVGMLTINEWREKKSVQFLLKDIALIE